MLCVLDGGLGDCSAIGGQLSLSVGKVDTLGQSSRMRCRECAAGAGMQIASDGRRTVMHQRRMAQIQYVDVGTRFRSAPLKRAVFMKTELIACSWMQGRQKRVSGWIVIRFGKRAILT